MAAHAIIGCIGLSVPLRSLPSAALLPDAFFVFPQLSEAQGRSRVALGLPKVSVPVTGRFFFSSSSVAKTCSSECWVSIQIVQTLKPGELTHSPGHSLGRSLGRSLGHSSGHSVGRSLGRSVAVAINLAYGSSGSSHGE